MNGQTWIFYEKFGDLYVVANNGGGWGQPRRLTTNPARQSNPHVHSNRVVWEDWRGSVPEIWTATFNGTNWSGETILSANDGIPSRHPSIGGGTPGDFVAWEDSTAAGFRVMVRRHDGTNWLAQELITNNTAGQRDPCVSGSVGVVGVWWSDARHGDAEIYDRTFYDWNNQWDSESRSTNLPGACRHPSVVNEWYADGLTTSLIAFESVEPSGVTEIYVRAWNGATRISQDDGVPSVRPSSGSFASPTESCGQIGGSSPQHYVAYTDMELDGTRSHHVWGRSGIDDTPGTGISTSMVSGRDGIPEADIFEVWIERPAGVPTLTARFGRTAGCQRIEIQAAPSLLLGPEGIPENIVRTVNECGGEPLVAGLDLYLESELLQQLTWDPMFDIPSFVETDAAGEAQVALHGGGCSATGYSQLSCYLNAYHEYVGAKSPDVNGDCWVRGDDLAYVQSRVGTNDFCADLDMSGTVGPEDVAIVELTMGDHCSNVTAVDEVVEATLPGLHVEPNPAGQAALIRIVAPTAQSVDVVIADPAGRIVRSLAVDPSQAIVRWDLRNESGQPVADGLYFAAARIAGSRFTKAILVVR
jgi:beta propeller repeat protein